jgi:hypothetical protein
MQWKALPLVWVSFVFAAPAIPAETADTESAPFRVRLQDVEAAHAVERALHGADARLAEPACREVLGDFLDTAGESLRTRMEAQGVSERAYLRRIVFAEDRHTHACRSKDTLAATSPGSRVVFVCPTAFARAVSANPEHAEATLIHEMLHTLGLGENPPSSQEITARVLARCAPARQRSR